jgi:flavin-dependent dehydrogenase
MNDEWDVAIVGAGPAGLAAAEAAVRAGARTVVLERAVHPRYKTCGGGLIGASLAALRDDMPLPARDHIGAATFTLRGKRTFTRRIDDVLLTMASREEFDDALRLAAAKAGAVVRQRSAVRSIGQDNDRAYARLADGTEIRAKVLVGADGSAGISARYVNVEFSQVVIACSRFERQESAAPALGQHLPEQRVICPGHHSPGVRPRTCAMARQSAAAWRHWRHPPHQGTV